MRASSTLIAAAVAVSAGAQGFDPKATIYFKPSDTVLSPGESLTLEVWCDFSPGVGEIVPYNFEGETYFAEVKCFHLTGFAIIGTSATSGTWSEFKMNPSFNGSPGALGTPIGNSIFQISALNEEDAPENPIFMYSAIWTPSTYTFDQIDFVAKSSLGLVGIELKDALILGLGYPAEYLPVSITIVPTPGVGIMLLAACPIVGRRAKRG